VTGESDSCDASSVSLIDEQVCSRDFKVDAYLVYLTVFCTHLSKVLSISRIYL